MLRFQPDNWLEGMLRPFLLGDPVAGLYFETPAPDWRFAAFAIFTAVVLASRAGRAQLNPGQVTTAVGLLLLFYVWTFLTGNGRYFIWGLMLVGPLLVLANRLLPGTSALRLTLLLLVVLVQGFVLHTSYTRNAWGLVDFEHNPVHLDDSPLREEPAVFLTISGLSYSILVPRFHPRSRWANIAGQNPILSDRPEHERLVALLSSPLAKYLVLPLDNQQMDASGHPAGGMASLATDTLGPHRLELAPQPCTFLRSRLSRVTKDEPATGPLPEPGFWFCPLQAGSGAMPGVPGHAGALARLGDVFGIVEQRCPRFFPRGDGHVIFSDDMIGRFYTSTDVRLYAQHEHWVMFRYFRALNPSVLGTVGQVRRGEFSIPCGRLPGRYRPPWISE